MTSLLLAPHYDDESLFCAYTILRHRPYVVTCFGEARIQEQRGGPTGTTRREETRQALSILDPAGWEIFDVRDDRPDVDRLRALITILARQHWDKVFAPAVEDGGHDQHNLLGEIAQDVFGEQIITPYLTYRRGYSRSWSRNEVTPGDDWPAIKFQAMSCYASQINLADTRPWFAADDCLREWYA